MKVANNMDSVFANCTEDELDFDAFFDDDDCLIDMVAGVDEAGNLLTGEDFDFDMIQAALEAEAMVGENPDFDYQKDGDASGSLKDAEGTHDKKPEVGGEVGTSKSIASIDSAEKHANDTKEEEKAIGINDKQQRSLKEADEEESEEDATVAEDEKCCKEDAAEGPLEDDDEAERNGELSDATIATDNSCCESAPDVTAEDEAAIEAFDKAIDAMLENVNLNSYKEAAEDAREAKNILAKAKSILTNTVATDRSVNKAIAQGKDPKPYAMSRAKAEWNKLSQNNKNLAKAGVAVTIIAAAASAGIAIAKSKKNKAEEDNKATNESVLADKILESVLGGNVDIDALLNESDSPIDDGKCPNDSDVRDGHADRPTDNVEGKDADPIGAAITGISHKDVIEDLDDTDQRDGKTDDSNDVEGVSSKIVEAVVSALVKKNLIEDLDDAEQRAGKTDGDKHIEGALESALEEFELEEVDLRLDEIDITLEAEDNVDDIIGDDINAVKGADETVPDSVQKADDANEVPMGSDAKRAEEVDLDEASIMEAIKSIFEEAEVDKAAGDDDEDEALVDIANDLNSEDVGDVDLSYDADDEDLIDMVSSGKVDLDDID